MHDVVVVGGGVIGLSIARELAQGQSVLVLERGAAGQGTSRAAAGMLSPQSEADDAGPFFQLCMASFQMYRRFAEELQAESAIDPGYEEQGLLVLAATDQDFATLESRARWQKTAGLSADVVSPDDVLKLEPLITAQILGALFLKKDIQIVPRRLTKALAEACLRRKVRLQSGFAVDTVVSENGRVTGVRAGSETIPAGRVIIAGGVWSREIEGLSPRIPVFPRKGQILSLTMPPGAFRHMIRWGHSYFVPRRDGELVVGATNEDVGFDSSLTPAGIGRLLGDAQQISSHTGTFPIRETWSGFRPATPDGLPIIGESAIKDLFYATGHYRNGILLAPITASISAALVTGKPLPFSIEPFLPGRSGYNSRSS